jgi:NAD(P)-dependent dehydrogenase (short-subunit alcohol dehydrogenase family)
MPHVLTDVGLRDAVVIVTGGGRGIGAATARQLGATGTPEEVAVWITLLLSPLASFMTGAVIPLDGGQVIDRE